MRSDTASRLTAGTVPRDGFVALCNDFLMLKGAVLAHRFLCSGRGRACAPVGLPSMNCGP